MASSAPNPRLAALAAASAFPMPAPVPAVSYYSAGRVLVIGSAAVVLAPAATLARTLAVTVLLTEAAAIPETTGFPVFSGRIEAMQGWLGSFDVRWGQPDGKEQQAGFDLLLDLQTPRYFTMHQPPQGYFAPGNDPEALQAALEEIADAVGDFEKPKFFLYHEQTCAHSRSALQGCDRCIDVCSTQAIAAEGGHIRVEPHLCMGCGACASVCPSGAMRYNFPSMPYWGDKLKPVLAAYRDAGGADACLLLYSPAHTEMFADDGVALPQRVIPLETHHVAAIGSDWLLGALALGANQVAVLIDDSVAPQYLAALREQMTLAEEILHGMGYHGTHFRLVEKENLQSLAALEPTQLPAEPAAFRLFEDKRTTLEFCIEHFARHAPTLPGEIALPAEAPFGTVAVDGAACTLCYSCVSVCPAAALQDGAGQSLNFPQLRFVERNCVQCGLCAAACPEHAISLAPRLLLTAQAKQPQVLHQDSPFHCVRCGKAFGTASMIARMTTKLAGHSMFSTPEALNRLKMCGDCRVVDVMAKQPEAFAAGAKA